MIEEAIVFVATIISYLLIRYRSKQKDYYSAETYMLDSVGGLVTGFGIAVCIMIIALHIFF